MSRMILDPGRENLLQAQEGLQGLSIGSREDTAVAAASADAKNAASIANIAIIKKVYRTQKTLTYGAINGLSIGTQDVAVVGARAGDIVLATPQGAIGGASAGLIPQNAYVQANDNVRIPVLNVTAATPLTPAALVWDIVVISLQ